MILDQLVFQEAWRAGVDSSVLPALHVFTRRICKIQLVPRIYKESDANPFVRDKAFADLEYGWAKLMGEMALAAYHKQYGMKTAAVRSLLRMDQGK
jgi:UDP-glucose 4-epimerase